MTIPKLIFSACWSKNARMAFGRIGMYFLHGLPLLRAGANLRPGAAGAGPVVGPAGAAVSASGFGGS